MKKTVFLKVVGGHLGTFGGYQWLSKNSIRPKITTFRPKLFFWLIKWYGYQSNRTGLIKLSKLVSADLMNRLLSRGGIVEEDGRRWKKKKFEKSIKKGQTQILSGKCRGRSGDLSWGTNSPKKYFGH